MTPRERQCLNAIRDLTCDGVPPSYDELCAALSIRSKSGVHRLIESLEAQGHVTRDPQRPRSLRLTRPPLADSLDALIKAHGLTAVEDALQARHRRAS